jgi:hypothetical protein
MHPTYVVFVYSGGLAGNMLAIDRDCRIPLMPDDAFR